MTKPSAMRRPWTPEEEAFLRANHVARTNAELAAHLGRTAASIGKKKEGLGLRKTRVRDEALQAAARRLAEAGKTAKAVGRELGMTRASAAQLLLIAGVSRATGWTHALPAAQQRLLRALEQAAPQWRTSREIDALAAGDHRRRARALRRLVERGLVIARAHVGGPNNIRTAYIAASALAKLEEAGLEKAGAGANPPPKSQGDASDTEARRAESPTTRGD